MVRYFLCFVGGLVLACLYGCGGSTIGSSRSTLLSEEAGPARGPIVAVEVRTNGDMVCTKSDDGPWTSIEGGMVDFYLRAPGTDVWERVGSLAYDPQPPEGGTLYEVVLPGAALNLPVGNGYSAQCKALPFIDLSQDPGWEGEYCVDPRTGVDDLPCTSSGVYDFDVLPDPPSPGPMPHENCGLGNGNAVGLIGCLQMQQWPPRTYNIPFHCDAFEEYEVEVVTASGQTLLEVVGPTNQLFGTSASSGAVDRISFSTASSGWCMIRLTVAVQSKFMLLIRNEHGADNYMPSKPWTYRWTFIVDAGHGKEPPSGSDWPTSDCGPGNRDDDKARRERNYNLQIVAALQDDIAKHRKDHYPLFTASDYDVISYDGTVLPWAARREHVSIDELRSRETVLFWGCDGYRGYLMRQWIKEHGRDPGKTLALQIHNDTWDVLDEIGSESAYIGNHDWFDTNRRAMQDLMGQPWLGLIPSDDPHMGFVRGATGFTTCTGPLTPEDGVNCPDNKAAYDIQNNATRYGPGLDGAVLLEVAHFDDWTLLFDGSDVMSADTFLEQSGRSLAEEIRIYLAQHVEPWTKR